MTAVSVQEGEWRCPTSRNRLFYRLWQPAAARALLLILHGFGEHGGRYRPMAEALAACGIGVAIPDFCGHGRSSGRRGDLEVACCVSDLTRLVTQRILPATGRTTFTVFGHSFGGLLAIQFALQAPQGLRALIAQSPLLEVGFPVPRWKTATAARLATWWPTYAFNMKLDVKALSHDAAVVEAYRADPLVHHAMSARAYRSIIHARDEAVAQAPMLRLPTLLLCGTDDRIISLEAARRWFDRLACEKSCVMFAGCYHELHHETVREAVIERVKEWTLSHGAPAS